MPRTVFAAQDDSDVEDETVQKAASDMEFTAIRKAIQIMPGNHKIFPITSASGSVMYLQHSQSQ